MSIVVLDKVTFIGELSHREELLEALQHLGVMHLVSLNAGSALAANDGVYSTDTRKAIKDLEACPIQCHSIPKISDQSPEEIARLTLDIQQKRIGLNDERDHLVKAIRDLTPWGEFEPAAAGELNGLNLWTYQIPHRMSVRLDSLTDPYAIINRDPQYIYAAVLAADEPQMIAGFQVQLAPRPLSVLKKRLDEIDDELSQLEWQRAELTPWIERLKHSIDLADDEASRQWARDLSLDSQTLFALQGFAPRSVRDELIAITNQHVASITFRTPADDEEVPTLLKNSDLISGAEGAVTFYLTPAYNTWDPTRVVFYSFSLFYAMIIADAGYGMLMGIALAITWKQLGKSQSTSSVRYLLLSITSLSIVFGIMVGSYFGVTPPKNSTLGYLQVLDFANRSQMMFLSLVIGVVHLSLSNIIAAWNARRHLHALGSLGWVMILWGGFLIAANSVDTDPKSILGIFGNGLLIAGLAFVLLFSSQRPLSSLQNWALRLVDGVSALTNVTKLFGDVLSYLRLFALGLASAQLAATFNQLASDLSHVRGIGILLAIMILIGGHSINLVLGLMGGLVHGLRLNCIEFFNWSLTESGIPFRSFRKKATM